MGESRLIRVRTDFKHLNLLAVWNGAERVFLVRILPDRKNRRQFFSDPGIISASEKTETTVQSARQRENSLFILYL